MYKLVYLPAAHRDMVEIARYISRELNNPQAALRLANELTEAGERVLQFPYANPVYMPIRPLEREYRKLFVRNYCMFYWVEEAEKHVVIARVLYARRDHGRFLE